VTPTPVPVDTHRSNSGGDRQLPVSELGIYILPGRVNDPDRGLREATDAERIGFRRVWLAERYDLKEAGVVCGAVAASTTAIRVATGVVADSVRSPLMTAALGATMQGMFPGRFALGIGRGDRRVLEPQGFRHSNLARFEDYIQIVKRLWTGDVVTYDGPLGKFPSMCLVDRPEGPPPELLYGTFGTPKAIEMAARHFDGIILTPYLTVDAVRRAAILVREAVERNGRDPKRFRIVHEIVTAPDYDAAQELAVVAARAVTNFQMPVIGELFVSLNGWDLDDLDRLRAHPLFENMRTKVADQQYRRLDLLDAAKLLPRHWLEDSAGLGSSADVCDRLREYLDAGADEIVIHGSSPMDNRDVVRIWRERDALRQVNAR
jgi:probable F420-dependent oxidoreductase